ncbi:MAG: hypothetical protein E7233_01925 [Lachnospiraceae bacterium]|nr:hypothetical protein [Lachnospiraceae bacterium]
MNINLTKETKIVVNGNNIAIAADDSADFNAVILPRDIYEDVKTEIMYSRGNISLVECKIYLNAKYEEKEKHLIKLHNEELLQKENEIAELQLAIEQLKADLTEKENEISDLGVELKNRRRISKERANADRDIHPKKTHDGYMVLSLSQTTDRHQITWDDWEEVPVWKLRLQTPHVASLPYSTVKNNVELEIPEVLEEMGCKYIPGNCKYDDIDSDRTECCAYRKSFFADYKAGYWNIDIVMTDAVVVPEARR